MKFVWTLAKFVLGAGLIAALFLFGGLDLSVLGQAAARWGYVAAGVLVLAPAIPLQAVRWHGVLGAQGIRPPLADTVRINYIGMFFSMCLPGVISGDVAKAYYVARDHSKEKVAEAAATVLVDRIIGALGLQVVVVAALVIDARVILADHRLSTLAAALIAAFVLVWGLIFVVMNRRLRVARRRWLGRRGKLARLFMRLDDAVAVYRDRRTAAWVGIGISVVCHILSILACFFFGRALGDEVLPFRAYMCLVPIGSAANGLPVSPMGLGVGEACFEGLFLLRGSALGAEIQVLWRMGMAVAGIVGFAFYVSRRRKLAGHVAAGKGAQARSAAPLRGTPPGRR